MRQCPDALAQVDLKSRSETNEAFVASGALSGAEVAPPSVTLVQVTDACQSAFELTMILLATVPVLSAPRYDLPFKFVSCQFK